MRSDLPEKILTAAVRLERMLRRAVRPENREERRLSVLQVQALRHIKNHEGITASAFADALHASLETVTPFIDRLAGAGWMERMDSPDGGGATLRISPEGEDLLRQNRSRRRRIAGDLLEALHTNDQEELLRMLESLLQRAERLSPAPTGEEG